MEALATLHRGIELCRLCRLCTTRRHAVPGEGPHDATIMFIGDAPGEQEHGRIARRDDRPTLPAYHPAAGMRFPEIRAHMIEDFRRISIVAG